MSWIVPTARPPDTYYDAVVDFGFVGDHRVTFDGACSSGTPGVITSATIAFTAQDVGKRITLAGAGASGAMYAGTISSLNSGTSVNVSPNITTTVSNAGIQVGTDNTAAINLMATTINGLTYPGAVVNFPLTSTNRFGFPIGVTFNKPCTLIGIGGSVDIDFGDYTKAGGTALVWWGTNNGQTTFDGMIKFIPISGASAQPINSPSVRHLWIDGRNGDQNPALYGIQAFDCVGFDFEDIFFMDCIAGGLYLDVLEPIGGTANTSRGIFKNMKFRALENSAFPVAATLTPTTTTSAVTLTTTGQSLTLAAANGLITAGYVWVQTANGYPVLVNYTGGGGTTTLTGCTVSANDAAFAPTTVSGSNVVQAVPANGPVVKFAGSTTGNTNLFTWLNTACNHGTTWGPAAFDCRNLDSAYFEQVVINGGNATNDGAINRIRKPGWRLCGSNTNIALSVRNCVWRDGDPGAGGFSAMGLLNTGAKLTFPSQGNIYHDYQLGNGSPVPTIEQVATSTTQGPAGASFIWTPNGGIQVISPSGPASVAQQSVASASTNILLGSLISVPPQGFQPGTTIEWVISGTTSTGAAVSSSWLLKVGTAGSTADATLATGAFTGTAATSPFIMKIRWTIRTNGPSASSVITYYINNNTSTGIVASASAVAQPAVTAFSTVTSGIQYAGITLTTGSGQVIGIQQVDAMVIKPANP